MISNMMRNLNRNLYQMDKRQMQVATGKRIHKPSDDPVGISRSLKVRADISQLAQYNKNVDDAISWLETTELAIKNTNEAVHRLRELSVQAANGVLTAEETTKIQEEVKELKAQIISLGNTSYGSSYIFSGKKVNQPLFDIEGNYLVDLQAYKNPTFIDDKKDIQVGNHESIGVNTLGFELFEGFERPVVYSREFPLANGDVISLQMKEGEPPVTVTLIIGTPEETVTNQEGTAATITVNSADAEVQRDVIINGLKEMGKIYGSPLKGYDFEKHEANEWNGTNVEDGVLRIKAVPKDATAFDTRQMPAVWETGAIDVTELNLIGGDTETFTFMGVKLNISLGFVSGTEDFDIKDIDRTGGTIVINELIADPADPAVYAEAVNEAISKAISKALEDISKQTGSKIAGFSFQPYPLSDPPDPADSPNSLRIIAPVNTGPAYNKEIFGGTLGTLGIENKNSSPDTMQLVVIGEGEKRTTAAGQKAGIIQLIDKLERELLKGNTEEIGELLGQIDAFHQQLLKASSEIGAKSNRMDLVKNRIADDTINFKNLLSQLEDADMAEVIMELINEENVYRSSLSVGARIIQPTLLDFLR